MWIIAWKIGVGTVPRLPPTDRDSDTELLTVATLSTVSTVAATVYSTCSYCSYCCYWNLLAWLRHNRQGVCTLQFNCVLAIMNWVFKLLWGVLCAHGWCPCSRNYYSKTGRGSWHTMREGNRQLMMAQLVRTDTNRCCFVNSRENCRSIACW